MNEQQVQENMITYSQKSVRDETFSVASSKIDKVRMDSQQKSQFLSIQVLEHSDADMHVNEHA